MNQVIFLNGASSSGKSTLAHALQARLSAPYLYFPEDDFWARLPEREIAFEDRVKVYYGFLHCIATLAATGNRVIVDTVSDDPAALRETARLLAPFDALFVGVHCDLAVLEAREQARGDRTPGTARRQYERVHQHGVYDIEVDTAQQSIDDCIAAVLAAPPPTAFVRLRELA